MRGLEIQLDQINIMLNQFLELLKMELFFKISNKGISAIIDNKGIIKTIK